MRNRSFQDEISLSIELSDVALEGSLGLPASARGIVIFAHGSGSSRFSPRNRFVADFLQQKGQGTLLFDLLTAREDALDERTAEIRFDIAFLARRLIAVTRWLSGYPAVRHLRMGYFGASTGAAAALVAAADLPAMVQAVVSRGGRPDLAAASLPKVKAPTLLIVGGGDREVIEMNRQALAKLKTAKDLVIVPGATHLFEEPGALEQVARLAGDWFDRYLI
jgi:putative phosphoribosyl transferase